MWAKANSRNIPGGDWSWQRLNPLIPNLSPPEYKGSGEIVSCPSPKGSFKSVGILAVLVLLGLGLRTYHYLRDPPMWHDEAAQVMNVLNKSFGEQLGPLYYSEAAPPLFMWAEKGIVLVMGDSTFSLRLLPFVASCLALIGVLWIGWRVLSWPGLLWLGLLFGCSDRLLWHCCEAKPYAVDVLLTVVLLVTLVRPWESPENTRNEKNIVAWLLLYACLSPVLIWLSFPACFLLGGLTLCWLPAVWRQRWLWLWAGFSALVLFQVVAFLALYLGPVRAQRAQRLLDCWQGFFPSWDQPWRVPLVLVQRWTEIFRYACEPVGNVLCGLTVVGGVMLWQQGHKRLLAFLVLPLLLATAAWLQGQYLIGPLRMVVFWAPAALLLIAAGIQPVLNWLRARTGLVGPLVLMGLVLWPVGQAGVRLVEPWKRLDAAEPAAFVLQQRQPHEAVVGTLWEQAYYFRALGTAYRPLAPLCDEPPSLPPTAALDDGSQGFVKSLWFLGLKQEWDVREALQSLPPKGAWVANKCYRFPDLVVVHAVLPRGDSR